MSRFSMVLAAAVATAMLVIAVSTLDAVGADPPKKAASATDLTVQIANCLRDRGVSVPGLTGPALDRWLRTHRVPDADVRACKMAIAPPEAQVREAPSADVTKLSECLRAQGFDAPTDPLALKKWIGDQRGRDALRAIKKCGVDTAPAPCGGGKPAPDSPKAPRPDAGAADPVT